MKNSVSRVLAAAAVVAALGLTTACNDDSGKSSEKDKAAKGDKAATAPAAGSSLTEAQLTQAAVTKADVKGYLFKKMSKAEVAEGGQAKADKAQCQPIAAFMGAEFNPAPTASVFQTYGADKPDSPDAGLTGMIRISAYKAGEAEKTVEGLRAALGACSGGFTVTDETGDKEPLSAKESPAPKLGDEALGFTLRGGKGSDAGVMNVVVVRSGAQLTAAFGFDLKAMEKPRVAEAAVAAQVAKLEKAAAKS